MKHITYALFSSGIGDETLVRYESDKPITLEMVVEDAEKTDGPINWERNSVTLFHANEMATVTL